MIYASGFQVFFLYCLSSIGSHASSTPDDGSALEPRNNHYNLKCSNAPSVIAGTLLSESEEDLQEILPASGSSEPWYHYLWCTPGTKTYTFFNFGQAPQIPNPSPNQTYLVEQALAYTEGNIQSQLNTTDGPVIDTPGGNWTYSPPNTNVQLYVQDYKKQKITWGILASALGGLANATYNYNHENTPLLFQINDGKYGEQAIGYAGLVDPDTGECQYSVVAGQNYPCSAVANGSVIGGLY